MLIGVVGLFQRSCTARLLSARDFSTKFFVAGLSYDTNETVLRDAFGQHGEIIEVKVICDHVSGKSKGYGFLRFTSEVEADMALKEMNGQVLDGRSIRVRYAHSVATMYVCVRRQFSVLASSLGGFYSRVMTLKD